MKITQIKIEDLKPYKLNAKRHPQSQIEGLAESIRRFGFTQPVVVDSNNEIIIGHGRLEASKLVGLKEVPCLRLEDLNEREVRALRLIDNRISETGWEHDLLSEEIRDLDFDFSDFKIEFDFSETDYSILDENDVDSKISEMAGGVKKAIQIEFDIDDYDEAFELVKHFREQGLYIGGFLVQKLKQEKEKQ